MRSKLNPLSILLLALSSIGVLIGGGLLVMCYLGRAERNTSGGDAWALFFFASLLTFVVSLPALLGAVLTLGNLKTARVGIAILMGYPILLIAGLFFLKLANGLGSMVIFSPVIILNYCVAYAAAKRTAESSASIPPAG